VVVHCWQHVVVAHNCFVSCHSLETCLRSAAHSRDICGHCNKLPTLVFLITLLRTQRPHGVSSYRLWRSKKALTANHFYIELNVVAYDLTILQFHIFHIYVITRSVSKRCTGNIQSTHVYYFQYCYYRQNDTVLCFHITYIILQISDIVCDLQPSKEIYVDPIIIHLQICFYICHGHNAPVLCCYVTFITLQLSHIFYSDYSIPLL
jgi:hypothetical protein